MFSLKYASVFVVAGMNLSAFTPPTPSHWNESSLASVRAPASDNSTCGTVSLGLKGQSTSNNCVQVSEEGSKKAVSQVQVTKEVVDLGEGKKETSYVVDVSTEAKCDNCDVSAERRSESMIMNASEFNLLQARLGEIGEAAIEGLNSKIKKKNDILSCKKDENGDDIDQEDRLQCRIDRMEDMDEEDADKYFDKHIKDDLEKMALSGNDAERQKALAALNAIERSGDISKGKVQSLADLKAASTQLGTLAQLKNQLALAAKLPDGHPLKAQIEASAKQQLAAVESQKLRNLEQQILSGGTGGTSAYQTNIDNATLELYAAAPSLAKTNVLNGNGTGTAGDGRMSRGGNSVTDPQTAPSFVQPHPSGAAPTGTLPANNDGIIRGNTMGNSTTTLGGRIPTTGAPVTGNNGGGPAFMNLPNGAGTQYQSTYPMGTQYLN